MTSLEDDTTTPTVSYSMSAVSTAYWEGLAEGRLMLPRCDSCGTAFFYPRMFCPHCWSGQITWVRSEGRGVVYTACEVNAAFDGRPDSELPYTVALIDLEEGVRIAARLDGGGMTRIGSRVVIEFGDAPANSLPVFSEDRTKM